MRFWDSPLSNYLPHGDKGLTGGIRDMNRISELGTGPGWFDRFLLSQERQRGFLAMELDSSVLRPPEQYAQHDKGGIKTGFLPSQE